MREYIITARGNMSPEQLGIIERYLGRQGIRTEISEAKSVPLLGAASLDELYTFAQQEGFSRKIATRTWSALERSEGMDYPYGIGIGVVLFDGDRHLDLDATGLIIENRLIDRVPNFGPRTEQFLQAFIESRIIQSGD